MLGCRFVDKFAIKAKMRLFCDVSFHSQYTMKSASVNEWYLNETCTYICILFIIEINIFLKFEITEYPMMILIQFITSLVLISKHSMKKENCKIFFPIFTVYIFQRSEISNHYFQNNSNAVFHTERPS